MVTTPPQSGAPTTAVTSYLARQETPFFGVMVNVIPRPQTQVSATGCGRSEELPIRMPPRPRSQRFQSRVPNTTVTLVPPRMRRVAFGLAGVFCSRRLIGPVTFMRAVAVA